ncbi:MAG: P-loop NTPase [Ignisphaera sp.]
MQQDYRVFAIHSRLSSLKLVIPIVSPKGGVGKSTISSMLSLALSSRGIATGLLDLDITNPVLHIILGIDIQSVKLEETKGIRPLKIAENLEFMSMAFFTRDTLLPLRGSSIVNAIRELLAITNWNCLVLIVDTPPGLSDEVLELLLLLHTVNPYSTKPLLVTSQNTLSLISIKRLLDLIKKEEKIDPLGIICNMCSNTTPIQEVTRTYNIEMLGYIPFIQNFEDILGDVKALLEYSKRYLRIAVEKINNTIKLRDLNEDSNRR